MTIVERLQEIQKFLKVSVRALALNCNLKQQTLDKQIKGISEPSANTLISIANTYPEISAEWLLRGKGEMIRDLNIQYDRSTAMATIEEFEKLIKTKDETIAILIAKIKELEHQLNNK